MMNNNDDLGGTVHVHRIDGMESQALMDEEILAMLNQLAQLMDRAFVIPGTNIRIGIDAILGLFPVLGDTLSVAVSSYIYSFAKKAGVPWYLRARMVFNIFIDWLIGLVPFIGDAFDVAWKANTKNVEIITRYYEKHKGKGPAKHGGQADSGVIDADFVEVDETKSG